MIWRARLYNDISSRRETERRNEMLLKAALDNRDIIMYEGRNCS